MTNATPVKPAYFMVQVKAKSLEELSVRYAQPAIASLIKLGGEMIAGSPAPTVLGCHLAVSKHGNGANLV
jgi:hypothetical protein